MTSVAKSEHKSQWRLLRALVAAVLLGVLAWGIDWASLKMHLQQLKWLPASLAILGITLQFPISAWKWSWALRLHGLEGPFLRLLQIAGIGFFFNHFLPSAIGGDAYRAVKTMPTDGHGSRAFSAVIVERAVGFAMLLAIGVIGALQVSRSNDLVRAFLVIVLVGGCTGLVVLGMVYKGLFKPLTNRVRHTKPFQALEHNVGRLRNGGYRWAPLIGISILFQVVAVSIIYFLFISLGQDLSVAQCALIAAATGTATVIPLSINGLGIVEGSLVGTAVAIGAGYESAVVVAVLLRLLVIPHALAFGLLYAIRSP